MNRRKFLTALAGLGVSGLGLGAYARFGEPRWLRLSRHQVGIPHLKHALRLLHLSDLHLSDVVPLRHIRRAIDMGLAAKPDLICLTGDFITGRLRGEEPYGFELARLPDAAPTFACLGNHDGGPWVYPRGGYQDGRHITSLLAHAGITCLTNSSLSTNIQNQPLHLVGVGDLWAREMHPTRAFAGISPGDTAPVVLLSHNPDSKTPLQPYPWDLMLCGHTHGGQVRLPFVGTPLAPVKDHGFVEGVHAWDGRTIHISRGIGNVRGIRFNCRPEVSVLELRSA
jgi:predicted MPP superfamily phosphohydrolase